MVNGEPSRQPAADVEGLVGPPRTAPQAEANCSATGSFSVWCSTLAYNARVERARALIQAWLTWFRWRRFFGTVRRTAPLGGSNVPNLVLGIPWSEPSAPSSLLLSVFYGVGPTWSNVVPSSCVMRLVNWGLDLWKSEPEANWPSRNSTTSFGIGVWHDGGFHPLGEDVADDEDVLVTSWGGAS